MNNRLAAALSDFRARVRAIHDAYPGMSDDDLADTIDGESGDLDAAILATMRSALEREAAAAALADVIDRMTKRKARFLEGAHALRNSVLQVMQDSGIKKIAAPDMSLSVGVGKPAVVITDESKLPDEFMRVKREPNKTAIAAALTAGIDVPGAERGNAVAFVSVHRS